MGQYYPTLVVERIILYFYKGKYSQESEKNVKINLYNKYLFTIKGIFWNF